MNKINLTYLNLKTFTEQDALDYCQLNSINPYNIIKLNLWSNELTDITGIKLFKNLEELYLFENKIQDISVLKKLNNLEELYIGNNEIADISVIQYLKKLEILNISYLELESDQIKYINSLKNLETLYCSNRFKDMSIIDKLNKNIKIYE